MARSSLHGILEQFIERFADAVAERAGLRAGAGGAAARAAGGTGARMCPFPACGNAGAGPRNRWFCREHSHAVPVREQKRILAERAAAEKSSKSVARGAGGRRGPARGRKLDMKCRVEGCKNTSRGPRFGFICDDHRKKLSVKEQLAAREKWNAAHAKKAA